MTQVLVSRALLEQAAQALIDFAKFGKHSEWWVTVQSLRAALDAEPVELTADEREVMESALADSAKVVAKGRLVDAAPVEPVADVDASYDMIDRFLRNNLDDDDYTVFSTALDAVYGAAPPALPPVSDAMVRAAERELWMGGMRDVSDGVVRAALEAARAAKGAT